MLVKTLAAERTIGSTIGKTAVHVKRRAWLLRFFWRYAILDSHDAWRPVAVHTVGARNTYYYRRTATADGRFFGRRVRRRYLLRRISYAARDGEKSLLCDHSHGSTPRRAV